MEFVCITCHLTQPIGLGARLPSGSWRCTDTIACSARLDSVARDEEFPATWAGGHALVIEFGDEELFGRCQCGDPLGNLVIRPNESTDKFATLWERHVMSRNRG